MGDLQSDYEYNNMVDAEANASAPVQTVQARPNCTTCASTHVKDYEYPCRSCSEYSLWELADAPPWPQYLNAVKQWHAMKVLEQKAS